MGGGELGMDGGARGHGEVRSEGYRKEGELWVSWCELMDRRSARAWGRSAGRIMDVRKA